MEPRSKRSQSPEKRQKRFLALPEFVNPDAVAADLLNQNLVNGRDYLVVDVRDDDFNGGNIINAINIPSATFDANLPSIHQQLKPIPKLYFHCALSQVRGPKCAQKYVNFINASDEHSLQQQVFIVRGGYQDFAAQYQNNKDLVQNVSYGYPSN
ncbi:Rhodanese-like domain-containing protein [Globomyces pollinis-pini]|nr:Rhodanese-like domain-containing protein [Globomyces pollinis-pini]KAJ3000646.1 hypothetical protein HDV02_004331 [Globomyces sp. JEL0801]